MSRTEIRKKFDEIVDFAEVEKFLDTPVKRYSSGMYVRLAFAVAAHLEPEILIVDEVLAVGDGEFQKKCLGKMKDVSEGGRTILFVSHNLTAIQSLCNKGLLLKKGEVKYSGAMSNVIDNYLDNQIDLQTKVEFTNFETAIGNEYVRIKRVEVVSNLENGIGITVNTPFQIEFEFWNLQEYVLNLSLILWNIRGECIFNVGSLTIDSSRALYKSTCYIPANLLNDDKYSVQIHFVKDTSVSVYEHSDILSFEIYDELRKTNWYGKWLGAVRPKLLFDLNQV